MAYNRYRSVASGFSTDMNPKQPAYTVIGLPPTRAIRVIWALEEIGLDYKIEPARPHSDPITSVNPSGKVPALRVEETDGKTFEIIDSVAIL